MSLNDDGMLAALSFSSSLGGETRFFDISTFFRVGALSFLDTARPLVGPFEPDDPELCEDSESESLDSDEPVKSSKKLENCPGFPSIC